MKKLSIRRVSGIPDLQLALFDGQEMIEGMREVVVRSVVGEQTKVTVEFLLSGLDDKLAEEPHEFSRWRPKPLVDVVVDES